MFGTYFLFQGQKLSSYGFYFKKENFELEQSSEQERKLKKMEKMKVIIYEHLFLYNTKIYR